MRTTGRRGQAHGSVVDVTDGAASRPSGFSADAAASTSSTQVRVVGVTATTPAPAAAAAAARQK